MIPFARISTYGNTGVDPQLLLDVDFRNVALGTVSTVVDSKGHIFTKVGTGTTTVVNDSVKGHVLQTSQAYFTTPMVDDLKLSTMNFEIRSVFKCTLGSTENLLYATGDYPSASTVVPGIILTIFNSSGSQLFCTTASASARCIFPYTVNTWRDISFRWNRSTRVMTTYDNDTGSTIGTTTVSGGFGDGTQFSIGASYVRGATTNSFNGQIKSISIRRLT